MKFKQTNIFKIASSNSKANLVPLHPPVVCAAFPKEEEEPREAGNSAEDKEGREEEAAAGAELKTLRRRLSLQGSRKAKGR